MKLCGRSVINKSSARHLECKETYAIAKGTDIPLAVHLLFQAIAGEGKPDLPWS
jgi:hypothetical protein